MAGTFVLDIERFRTKVPISASLVIRKVAMDLLRRIVMRTPVDKGRARGNWQVGIGIVPSGSVLATDESGASTVGKGTTEIQRYEAGRGSFVAIVNNLVYIIPLEHGHSQQAPAGMVGVALSEYPGIVRQAASEVDR